MKLLATGFSAFPGAPVNPTETLMEELQKTPGTIADRCNFKAAILDVDFATIGDQLAKIAEKFAPDIALHFGLDADAAGFRMERFGRIGCAIDRPDSSGGYSSGKIVTDGPAQFESTLPRAEISKALVESDLPVSLDDQAGDYLCNAVFYLSRSGNCGAFRPEMSGFIHVPQLPVEDGGVPGGGSRLTLSDLAKGARLAVDVCINQWNDKRAAE